ncbi:arginase family protein [Oleiagrimonas soli]|uniref:Arginase family enzyme n=1 Tax=Oleiagrimonas soli TaxID=1543381 RepID=A0A099CVU2_9GAMM|nr:arginase family protein [Oleiagrimonas soli]KGI77752.1 hypothetical protein LF63_0104775 [Oleiagrimonas soli]MBB6183933.1 arginase family enzyme [Oleiagrimonas soli]
MRPIVLDLDGSVDTLERAVVVPLAHWCDDLRFACSQRRLRAFGERMRELLPNEAGTVFTGSGDFHHLSVPLIERIAAQRGPLEVVVFDNHPDNMRFVFGVHCGSWVHDVAALPNVLHVHVVGITSSDIGPMHAWENRLRPLRRGRLTYWSIGARTGWARALGMGSAFRNFDDAHALLQAFQAEMAQRDTPIYLSIDKDVLSPEDARTNWDQGCMREDDLHAAIRDLRGRIVGSDITGEVSVARYAHWWKRALSALDRQPSIPGAELRAWQAQQHAVNRRLLRTIDTARRA